LERLFYRVQQNLPFRGEITFQKFKTFGKLRLPNKFEKQSFFLIVKFFIKKTYFCASKPQNTEGVFFNTVINRNKA
jgi:hypothetical protein